MIDTDIPFPFILIGTNEDEERIVAVFKDETFEYYFKVSNPKRDLCYDSMIKYLKELKGDLIKNEKNYSSFTLFILSHGNEVSDDGYENFFFQSYIN